MDSDIEALPGDLLQCFEKATEEFKLCPNRVWAVAREKLPGLMPKSIKPIPGHEQHELCTFDFCEYSQRDFTAVEQRHECHECKGKECPECRDGNCGQLRNLFPRDTLEKAAEDGKSTVWCLDGTSMIEPPRPYMAISHVWSDGTGIGAWSNGEVNECLYTFFQDIATQFQCEGIWWDTLSIPTGKTARNMAIQKIPSNYQDARITLVHDRFLRNWEWDEDTACFAILMSPWFSRGWTAVELAKSRKVKVIFRGPCGPLIKDLDEQILAKNDETHGPRKEASDIIRNLREGITNLNRLFSVLGPRHTSWPKDMTTISALLAGVTPSGLQQDTYKSILRKIGKVSLGHLFHNAATMSKVSWCPTSLLNMPIADSDRADSDRSLLIEPNWDLVGLWIVIPVSSSLKEKCVWNGTHALMKEKAHKALTHPEKCVLLAEPGVGLADKALLVEVSGRGDMSGPLCCRYVGALYFHPEMPKECVAEGKETDVRLLGDTNDGTVTETAGKRGEHAHHSEGDGAREGGDINPNIEATKGGKGQKHSNSDIPSLVSEAEGGGEEAVQKLSQTSNLVEPVSQRTALHYAIWRGHEKVVKQLLERGADVNLKDDRGQTPLHLAAERGDKPMVGLLLNKTKEETGMKAILHAQCKYRQTALHRAAWGGSAEVAGLLLEKGSDPCTKDSDENTALHIAAEKGYDVVVALLIKRRGVDVNWKGRNGMTPLHYAAMYGHEGVVNLLLKNSAEVKATDNKVGWTPLHLAAMNGNEAVVKLLPREAADVKAMDNKVGWTPLHLAVMNGHEAVARLLLEKVDDRDLMQVDKFGWTLWRFAAMKGREGPPPENDADCNVTQADKFRWAQLHLAALNGPRVVVQLLLEQNANVNLTDRKGLTPLHGAAEHGYGAVVQLLLEKGANIDAKDRNGRTPLWSAAENGHGAVVQLLLEKGADVNAKDRVYDRTPLWGAAENGHGAVVQLLLEKGANIDAKDRNGRTPLWSAAENRDGAVVQLLLEKGANIDAKDGYGRTPLWSAAENGDGAVVQLLLEKGADVNAKDLYDRTPLWSAAENGHEGVVQLLKRYLR